MTHISLRIETVDIARAVLLQGREVIGPLLVTHIHDAVGSKKHSVSTVTCRHHAVHHVDTSLDGFQNVGRCADSHKVTRLVGGKYLIDHLNHVVHHLGRFTYGQAAYGVTVGTKVGNRLGRLTAQVGISASLHNREVSLRVTVSTLGFLISLPSAL